MMSLSSTFLFWYLFLLKWTFCDDLHCSQIDSSSNTIFNHPFHGEFYLESDGKEYSRASKQWAYPSFHSMIHPSLILYPDSEDDVFVALHFARECHYKVVIRSGGHQYSALSSCNSALDQCMQIDMKYFNKMSIDVSDPNAPSLEIGPGVKLGEMNEFLHHHGFFLPGGTSPGIGIGGLILTGGTGYLGKSHGLLADFVLSFDIILSDGTKLERVSSSSDDLHELYWCVIGGGPGAFGIVTHFELDLSKTRDSDHGGSMGFVYIFDYSRPLMESLGTAFASLHDPDDHYMRNPHVGSMSMWLAYEYGAEDYDIKIAWIWTGGVDVDHDQFGEERDAVRSEKYFLSHFFLDAASSVGVKPKTSEEINAPISQLMVEMAENFWNEAPMPYEMRANGMKTNIDDEFIDLLIDRTELVRRKYGMYSESGMLLVFTLVSNAKGAIYTNDPTMERTAIPYREQLIQFPVLMFYNDAIHEQSGRMSRKWLDDTMEVLRLTKPFHYGKDDLRDIALTFGDLDMERVWRSYYPDETSWDKLKRFKAEYDPIDLFHTSFTVPLPRRKRDL